MNYYALTSLFNGVVVLLIGFYLLSQQRQNSLYQSCAVLSICVGLWCIFYSFWQVQSSYESALTYMRLAMIFCYAIPFSFLWFTLQLTHVSLQPSQALPLLVAPLFFMVFGFSSLMIKGMKATAGFVFWPQPGILMHLYLVIFFCVVLFSYGLLLRGYFTTSGFSRRQIQWVMLALLPAWLGGATNWCLWYDIPVPPVAHIFVGVGFLLLFYAVARSRLFDIDAITDLVQEAKLSALGIMATSINHEVRNPLCVIKGLAETLLERPDMDSVKIRDVAQRAVAQAERALTIIRNFSDYAKRQNSKIFDKQLLDIREVLESITPLVCSELALDHIRLQINVPPKTRVCADRHSLEEIFINLIVNACQAMASGGEIEISAEEENAWITIRVRDAGPGLSPEQLRRIFEPFYTTKSYGTGLGLYVVKQLVEKNGGRIEAQSQPGLVTTFSIILPLAPSNFQG